MVIEKYRGIKQLSLLTDSEKEALKHTTEKTLQLLAKDNIDSRMLEFMHNLKSGPVGPNQMQKQRTPIIELGASRKVERAGIGRYYRPAPSLCPAYRKGKRFVEASA